jgi:hypothetical protein
MTHRRSWSASPDTRLLEWNLTQCQCGEIVLECGATSLRMTRRDLARLYRLAQAAMVRFHIDESSADVAMQSDVAFH